jgi:hypothetical protein
VLSDYLARVSGCAEYSQLDLFWFQWKAPVTGGGIRRDLESMYHLCLTIWLFNRNNPIRLGFSTG